MGGQGHEHLIRPLASFLIMHSIQVLIHHVPPEARDQACIITANVATQTNHDTIMHGNPQNMEQLQYKR